MSLSNDSLSANSSFLNGIERSWIQTYGISAFIITNLGSLLCVAQRFDLSHNNDLPRSLRQTMQRFLTVLLYLSVIQSFSDYFLIAASLELDNTTATAAQTLSIKRSVFTITPGFIFAESLTTLTIAIWLSAMLYERYKVIKENKVPNHFNETVSVFAMVMTIVYGIAQIAVQIGGAERRNEWFDKLVIAAWSNSLLLPVIAGGYLLAALASRKWYTKDEKLFMRVCQALLPLFVLVPYLLLPLSAIIGYNISNFHLRATFHNINRAATAAIPGMIGAYLKWHFPYSFETMIPETPRLWWMKGREEEDCETAI